jgi:uncharacterized protein
VKQTGLHFIIRLQQLDDELALVLSEQKGLPEDITSLDAQVKSLTAQLAVRGNRHEENLSKKTQLRAGILVAQEKIKKYKETQTKARNNKEYDALSKQIEYEEQEVKKAELQIRAVEESEDQFVQLEKKGKELLAENRYDEITADMVPTDDLKKNLADIETEVSTKRDELDTIVKSTQAEVDDLMKKVDKQRHLFTSETKPILTKYDHLRKGGIENVVVKFSRNACSGCNTRVPASRQAGIIQGNFYPCETCGRIIVHERLFEEVGLVPSA